MDNSLSIIELYMQVAACLFLATAFITLLLRKSYQKEPHFLIFLLLALLLFYWGTALWNTLHKFSSPDSYAYPLSFLEWILHAWIVRTLLPGNKRRFLDYLLIATVSVSLTIYIGVQFPGQEFLLASIHTGITGLLALLIIKRVIAKNSFYILQSPFFWLAIGSLFYACMSLLTQWATAWLQYPLDPARETELLLLFFNLVRFAIYGVATLVKEKG